MLGFVLAAALAAPHCAGYKAAAANAVKRFQTTHPECLAVLAKDELASLMKAKAEGRNYKTVFGAIKAKLRYDEDLLFRWGVPLGMSDGDGAGLGSCKPALEDLFERGVDIPEADRERCKDALGMAFGDAMGPVYQSVIHDLDRRFDAFRSSNGFRKTRWGMTRREVRRLVKGLKAGGNAALYGPDRIGGVRLQVEYGFAKDRLFLVVLRDVAQHYGAKGYIEDYVALKGLLTKRYGAPEHDGVEWDSNLREAVMEDLTGIASQVHLGHARLNAIWRDGQTLISISCGATDLKVETKIIYASAELGAWGKHVLDSASADRL
jgi:hypothetical protein